MLVIALWSVAHIMAFYIPMVPFIYWMSGMIGWLMQTVEAMVTAPIWVVGHAMPEGEGLAGDRGRQGYMLLLAILLRPLLMLLGLCIAMVLMQIVGKLMGFMFTVYVDSFKSHTSVMPLHSLVSYLVILTALMIIFTHKKLLGVTAEELEWLIGVTGTDKKGEGTISLGNISRLVVFARKTGMNMHMAAALIGKIKDYGQNPFKSIFGRTRPELAGYGKEDLDRLLMQALKLDRESLRALRTYLGHTGKTDIDALYRHWKAAACLGIPVSEYVSLLGLLFTETVAAFTPR